MFLLADDPALPTYSGVASPVPGDTVDDGDGLGWEIDLNGVKQIPGGWWMLTCSRAYETGFEA